VAPSGGAEKSLNMGAQLHIILYKKNKIFLKIARINGLSDCYSLQNFSFVVSSSPKVNFTSSLKEDIKFIFVLSSLCT